MKAKTIYCAFKQALALSTEQQKAGLVKSLIRFVELLHYSWNSAKVVELAHELGLTASEMEEDLRRAWEKADEAMRSRMELLEKEGFSKEEAEKIARKEI